MNYVLLLASIKTRTGQVRHIIHTRQILTYHFKELECNEEIHFSYFYFKDDCASSSREYT